MLEQLFGMLDGVVTSWRQEVARRREVTPVDPVADTIDYQARELAVVLKQLRHDFRTLTPEQYARLVGKSASTVRRWCARGILPCERDGAGDYVIPAGAKPKVRAA